MIYVIGFVAGVGFIVWALVAVLLYFPAADDTGYISLRVALLWPGVFISDAVRTQVIGYTHNVEASLAALMVARQQIEAARTSANRKWHLDVAKDSIQIAEEWLK